MLSVTNIFILVCLEVCGKRVELGFLVDGSESINTPNKTNFKRSLQFVKNIVNTFRISQSEVRVGLTVFSTHVNTIFKLAEYSDKESIGKVKCFFLIFSYPLSFSLLSELLLLCFIDMLLTQIDVNICL